jgi:flagellar hook-associated protein 2
MGSPITFSGFNQIDFNMILNAVMQQERTPLTSLENQKKSLETQNTTFGTFLAKLGTLETAIEDLADAESLATLTATSSDSGVGVATTSGTLAGSYDVIVERLAKAQVTTSSSTYASVDDVIGATGTLSLLVANQPPFDLAFTGSMTLKGLADAINARADAPVSASVVLTAPGSYRLVLTGRNPGIENAFTITSTIGGAGNGLTFADDGNGIYGELADGNTQNARDAELRVNQLLVTSASNTVEDVIPGVTLTLTKEDAAKTVAVSVKRDTDAAVKQVEKFISAYNDVVTFMNDQSTAAATGKTSIGRDPLLRSLRDAFRSSLQAEYVAGGNYSRAATVGLEFEAGGKLKLDKEVFGKALDAATASVQKLFAGTDGSGGIAGALRSVVGKYTEAGGLVATMRRNIDGQVSNLSKRLDTLETQLAIRRMALQKEYLAADMAMSQIKAQSSSLSALGGQYRLF